MIHVTKTYLPSIEKYTSYLHDIYSSGILTNNGRLLVTLEERLKKYLDLQGLLIVNNGTNALRMAIKAMKLTGEVITTPFSHVATTASIAWEQCVPVYVDIDKDTLCIDPALIEKSITPKTTAILATHVFGNACDIEAIKAIADKYGLKVIYDAAHAFGTTYKGHSIFHYGDISITSFHATKLFHMGEGGALFTKDAELLHKLSLLRNFGHTSPVSFDGFGTNGKNSELHAAMGLCVLDDIEALLDERKKQWQFYQDHLPAELQTIRINEQIDAYNHAYFPVIFPSEEQLLLAFEQLKAQQIIPRRYFYPSLNTLDYVNRSNCPVSEGIAPRVLCLPLFHELTTAAQHKIISVLLHYLIRQAR